MNIEEEDAIRRTNDILRKVFRNFYGSIRFNLHPGRNSSNINIQQQLGDSEINESMILTERNDVT